MTTSVKYKADGLNNFKTLYELIRGICLEDKSIEKYFRLNNEMTILYTIIERLTDKIIYKLDAHW